MEEFKDGPMSAGGGKMGGNQEGVQTLSEGAVSSLLFEIRGPEISVFKKRGRGEKHGGMDVKRGRCV